MGTAYIETTVSVDLGPVHLFEVDCTAEIEYIVDAGELVDWHIRDFKFEKRRPISQSGNVIWMKVAEAWCSDNLRPVLIEHADKDAIEERLAAKLFSEGEMYSPCEELRRDYHARVL